MKKTKTIKLNGQTDYAKVAQRIQDFREANPRGSITTTPTLDGQTIMFKAFVIRDKADPTSADGTGHSYGENKGPKDKAFEKLETIAVGRALAFLGYGADGEIASSEEMDEFNQFKTEKLNAAVKDATTKLKKAKTLDELKKIWVDIPVEVKTELEDLKEELKTKLTPKSKGTTVVPEPQVTEPTTPTLA